jgi:hypothetical protein
VSDSYGEQQRIGKINGAQVVNFSVSRAKGASDVTVYDSALEEIAKIEKDNPGVTFTQLFTSVDYTKEQYASSMQGDGRGRGAGGAGRVPVPARLAGDDHFGARDSALGNPTFWFMDLLGFTLNEMSLLALGLVAGVLVDDAIVEIENIVATCAWARAPTRRRSMPPTRSASRSWRQVVDRRGVPAGGLMPGISGQFFKNFGSRSWPRC